MSQQLSKFNFILFLSIPIYFSLLQKNKDPTVWRLNHRVCVCDFLSHLQPTHWQAACTEMGQGSSGWREGRWCKRPHGPEWPMSQTASRKASSSPHNEVWDAPEHRNSSSWINCITTSTKSHLSTFWKVVAPWQTYVFILLPSHIKLISLVTYFPLIRKI